jgi:K(+)-stimulated pyrophosphate-energized sodium pump
MANLEEVSIEKEMVVTDNAAEATITYAMTVNGEEVTKTESFKGTQAEVEKQVKAFEAANKLATGDAVKVIKKMDINKG